MNLIATNPSQELTMSSREIAKLVDKRHDNVMRVLQSLSLAGILTPQSEESEFEHNGNIYKHFLLCKRDSLVAVARFSPEFTAKIVDRWQELEASNAPAIPQTYAEALQLAADQAKLIDEQKAELAIAAPKAEFVDRFVDRENLMTATQVGQPFKMSAVKLNRALDEMGGVYNKAVKRGRAFCQSFVDDGYGVMKHTEQGYPQALFTPAGAERVTQMLTSEGVI